MCTAPSEELILAVLNRMNITYVPDEQTRQNIVNAIEEATSFLRDTAGSKDVSFESGEKRTLLIACAWYFVENKRADFESEYLSDLISLRLSEGFGCGKDKV